MKIAIDCHNLEGNRTGVGRYLWNLLREWSRSSESGLEFFLYFKNEIPQDVKSLANVGFPESHIRVLGSGSNALYKHWHLPRAVAKDNADVLFCPDYVLPVYAGRVKTAVTIHDIIYEARPDEYSWPSFADKVLLKWASKNSAKRADVIFVPSEFTKSEIIKHYRVNPAKIVVTPLAADPIFKKLDGVGPRQEWEDVKGEYNIQDMFFLFVGSIFNRRFLPESIKAFKEFAAAHVDFQFLIIGKNHTSPFQDIADITGKANKESGREAVIWKDHIDDDKDVVLLYNNAHATVWISSYEGFGLPVLESMACGTPVITSRQGSLPEVGGDAVIYVEDESNPIEILKAMNLIAEDENLWNESSKKGLERAGKFSWTRTSHITLEGLRHIY